jgi:hypothetical protein
MNQIFFNYRFQMADYHYLNFCQLSRAITIAAAAMKAIHLFIKLLHSFSVSIYAP